MIMGAAARARIRAEHSHAPGSVNGICGPCLPTWRFGTPKKEVKEEPPGAAAPSDAVESRRAENAAKENFMDKRRFTRRSEVMTRKPRRGLGKSRSSGAHLSDPSTSPVAAGQVLAQRNLVAHMYPDKGDITFKHFKYTEIV